MNPTSLEPAALQASMTIGAFKGEKMLAVQRELILLAMSKLTFTAPEVSEEYLLGDSHILGAATMALIAVGLIEATGERVKSPLKSANGRKVNVYRLCIGKFNTAQTWLKRHGYAPPAPEQLDLITA